MSIPLSHFVPAYPSPSLCPQVPSLHLGLYSCPAPRFFRTIFFLDFIYLGAVQDRDNIPGLRLLSLERPDYKLGPCLRSGNLYL